MGKDQSGSAFPLVATNSNKVNSAQGMTKRELIAMHAMQGLLASADSVPTEDFARLAVECADALLAELGRE